MFLMLRRTHKKKIKVVKNLLNSRLRNQKDAYRNKMSIKREKIRQIITKAILEADSELNDVC